MKAIITQKSELTLNLNQHFTFDILDDDGNTVLRLDSTNGLIKLWCDGNDNFDNEWDNREGLTYA